MFYAYRFVQRIAAMSLIYFLIILLLSLDLLHG